MNEPKLTIELIPRNSWGDNLRSMFSPKVWKALQAKTFADAGHKCEICGGVGKKHPVECHEVWSYHQGQDDHTGVQVLERLIALCPMCHRVKHIGQSSIIGLFYPCLSHLKKVNNWAECEARHYIASCFKLWEDRNQYQWQVNIEDWMFKQGIRL